MKKICDICHEEFDAISEDENICGICFEALKDMEE